MFATLWVKVEREKATVEDDDLFFVDDSTRCPEQQPCPCRARVTDDAMMRQ